MALQFLHESQPNVQHEVGRTPELAASSRLMLLHNPTQPGAPPSRSAHVPQTQVRSLNAVTPHLVAVLSLHRANLVSAGAQVSILW